MTDRPTGSPSNSDWTRVDQARLDANWRAIQVELDAPAPSRMERWLRRVGVPAQATRLVLATPALRRAWYLAIAGAVLIALAAADPDAPRRSALLWLTTSPLVGVLGVAMAYGPGADPAHELQLAAPMRGLRVLAIRTLVVLGMSTAIISAFTLLNPVTRPHAAAWFLPALAVTTTALALMTKFAPRHAATLSAVAWCAIVTVSQVGSDPLVVFTWVGQIVAMTVALVATVVAVRRRVSFDRLALAT